MKYTVKWNQGIQGNDIWRVGEERELTTDQFYWMEVTYPGCLVPVKPASMPEPKPEEPEPPRAETVDKTRMVAKVPVRPASRPSSKAPQKKVR